LNAKLAHSVSQCDGSEGSAGALAGEQPGRGQLLDDAASASQGQGLDEGGEGRLILWIIFFPLYMVSRAG
jgi:hypothetical protein